MKHPISPTIALTLVLTFGATGIRAEAQADTAAAAAAAPAAAEASTFDSYRAMALTAGIIGGAVVATVVTDGLILPLYCWMTGTTGAGAGAGAMAGTQAFRGTMGTLGAVSGGLYADAKYQNP